MDGPYLNGKCPHPAALAKPDPENPGKSFCGMCGVRGTIMTKGPGGLLLPKVDLGGPNNAH